MTSPGSEHVSRYRALGEFDNLVRAAKEAKRALKELREEESKLNAESLKGDKEAIASKQARAKAEEQSAAAAKKSVEDLNKGGHAGKSGEAAGVEYTQGIGKGVKSESTGSNKQWLAAATAALSDAFGKAGNEAGRTYGRNVGQGIKRETADLPRGTSMEETFKQLQGVFAKAGEQSGREYLISTRASMRRGKDGLLRESGIDVTLREFVDRGKRAGQDTGYEYVTGLGKTIKQLNQNLSLVGLDDLDLDVDIEDARQSIEAIEFELRKLANETTVADVRIDANNALRNLRDLKRVFKDEVAEDVIKETERIRKELLKIDALPSGKAFKFWALTALSDMSRVFEEAERGTSVFERLRKAAAGGGGGGGNFLNTFVSGFDSFSESSSKLLQRLGRVSGELYRMPGLIAALVSAIPALVAGLGALGGGALAVANGIGAAGGVLLSLPGLGAAAISTVSALSASFGDLGDVLKEAKKAQTDELYAREQARLGTEKALTPLQKYKALINDMLPATQDSTLAIVDFADAYTNAKERIGENFFKEVVGDIDNLSQILPIAENMFGKTATALGKVASEGLKMVTSGPWKADFKIIAENNAQVVENLGFAGLGVADAFRNIAFAAGPFTGWLTKGIRDAADAFAEWSAISRANGGMAAFLGETQESLQILWQVVKNLSATVSAYFRSTIDEGQRYLRTLENITGHWADVAKAQENANSPLRQWMTQIRPVLSALGALVGDLARGIGDLSTNQNNISSMIDLLDSLRTKVLPPILDILQHLNDSGIAVTVVDAIGEVLEGIAAFLNSGATQALTVFVTVLASFFTLIADIASLPGVSHVLGGVAAGIAAIAAVSVVARFTGLFKLWDFFNWMTRNRGNLSGAFADAARGAAGLSTSGRNVDVGNAPTTIANPVGGIGSEVLNRQERATTNVGNASQTAASRVGVFNRALAVTRSAGTTARNALSSLSGFLGGPWGVALTVATIAATVLFETFYKQKTEAKDTADALNLLREAYSSLNEGNTEAVSGLANSNEKVKELIESSERYGVSIKDVSGTLNNNEQATSRFVSQIDAEIAALEESLAVRKENSKGLDFETGNRERSLEAAKAYRKSIIDAANAQREQNEVISQSAVRARTYQERLAGMTQAQVDASVASNDLDKGISTLSGALDTFSNASANSTDRAKSLSDLINYYRNTTDDATNTTRKASEAADDWAQVLFNLGDAVEINGTGLGRNTQEALNNRKAMRAAAEAVRDLFLADIEAGTPMDEATKRHRERITALEKEAQKLGLNKEATKKLIDEYAKVPSKLLTDVQSDTKGFSEVYLDLLKLQVMQQALKEGKSPSEADKDWRNKQSSLYERYIPGKTGDGPGIPGYASGGAVWGAGTKTSDSIRAWLSNGEFVQPADAVDHYGMNVMEAVRTKKLDKTVIEEALPSSANSTSSFASGGPAHSANCTSCASGGHGFASGGVVRVPIIVNPRKTKIDENWIYSGIGGGALGGGSGGGGWQWQMNVLRQRFPGLPLWSGFRPGSRTLSGNQSYHALGRAVDLPPRRDVAEWIKSNYGARTKELITPFNDLNLHNGKPHRYTGAIWNQHNFQGGNAHDHWAFNQGGLVDIMKMMNMNNLTPSQNTSIPSTPRSLSSAASSVVNNSTDNARTFGDVIINNPMPERAGDSIRDALYRTTLLY